MVCLQCDTAVTDTQTYCPNCGAALRNPVKPRARLLTGRVWADFLLGATVQYLAHLATARVLAQGLPPPNPADPQHGEEVFGIFFMVAGEIFWALVLGGTLYLLLWRFPVVARGSGYATLLLLVALLGALFTCRPVVY